ncbi:MAG TPA: T9SS type A sorting domain-containing protein [Panacibacter sp.]|nr:T9SS type A sorting domain-containing protein [Panacibacter sp.]
MKTKTTITGILCIALAITTTNAISQATSVAANTKDSLALVDFYNSTNGPGWRYKTNWLTGPLRDWFGVVVTNARVTQLNLDNNRLKGSIPASIGNLGELFILNLPYNEISGNIPPELANLKQLNAIYLNNNQFSGTIPAVLGSIKYLNTLRLDGNNLTGAIPPELGNLKYVDWLFLSGNNLTGTLPPELGNLNEVYDLRLDSNQLTGSIPPEMGNYKHLISLILSNNKFTGTLPAGLENSPLIQLYLGYNQFDKSVLAQVANYKDLELFDFGYNNATGKIPPEIGNLKNLQDLYLNNNQLTGFLPLELSKLTSLRLLDLTGNKLRGKIKPALRKMVNLQYLFLGHNNFIGPFPEGVTSLPLDSINISFNEFTFDGLEALQQAFPTANYKKQAAIPIHQNGNALSVSAGGTLSNNTYGWFMVDQPDSIFIKGDSVFHPSKNGTYYSTITNSVATGLILKSDTIVYTAPAANYATNASEDRLQSTANAQTFTVYPNPAKYVLHIQTNGNALFSLINENGKIIFTKNISKTGAINISSSPAGLYYLKNNSTGFVQKVLVIK